MIKMTIHEALGRLCKATNKFGLYLSFDEEEFTPEEAQKACPFLDFTDNIQDNIDTSDYQAYADGYMFVLCDTEEECQLLFESVVGDEGPTKTNPYNGDCRVFCLIINDKGETENTNT